MSLFGALSASLTSLTAQSRAVNVISNNIANLSTTGFKNTSVSFATLVAGQVGGGVLDSLRQDITSQGNVNSTGVGTDLAIQGNGFFTVEDQSGNLRYTRAGSFRPDSAGNLVNEAGYKLYGWPLDSQGRLPGEAGNTNTRSNAELSSLVAVSTSAITGSASPTTNIAAKINLKAEQETLAGAGGTIDMVSTTNSTNSATDIIIPQSFAIGSTFTVTNTIGANTYTYGGIEDSANLATANAGAGVAGATSAGASFTTWTNGDSFTIKSDSMTTAATYTFNNPSTEGVSFKNLNELATLIDGTDGLRASVSGNVLYVAPDNASEKLTFGDVGAGTIAADLSLVNTTAVSNRFASVGDLAALTASTNGLNSTVNSPAANTTLSINNVDPTDTIKFTSSDADLLTEFGLTSATIPAVYDPTVTGHNMASGGIAPQFSSPITIFDSQGKALDVRVGFTKISSNSTEDRWAVELYAVDPATVENTGNADGLLASGTISFDGDGNLSGVSGDIAGNISVDPAGVATSKTVTMDFGEIGTASGLSEFAGDYTIDTFTQDGFPTGRLQSLQVDSQGFVTAIFDNSLTSKVFKIPLAYFPNGDGLVAESGNAYSSSTEAGQVKLRQVGDAGVGTIVPDALESSTADIGQELTKLVVSQQSYSASANVLRKVNDLFDELKNL